VANEVEIRVVARDQTAAGFDSAQARATKLAKSVAGGPSSAAGAFVEADKKAQGFSGTLKRVGEIAAGVLAAQALQAGARRFVAFIQSGIKAASDLGESVNAVNKVFGTASDDVLAWGKANANAIGLSTRAFNQLATPLGAMLKNAGLGLDEVTDHTIKLTERAADMASVFNVDVAEAMTAIQAGLRGEADPLERFGVQLSAVAVEARALADTGKNTAATLTAQEKALARLNILYDQTKDTAGDFRGTADGLANSQRIATATIEDAKAKIAAGFIPVMAKAAQVSGQLAEKFVNLPKGVQSTTVAVVALGAALVLLVPRLAATKAGLVSMGLAGDGARISLLSLARVAGVAALAFGAMKLAENIPLLRGWGDAADNAAVKLGILNEEHAKNRTAFSTVWGQGGWVDHAIADGKNLTFTFSKIAETEKALGTATKTAATVVDEASSDMADSWEETFEDFDNLEKAYEGALDKLSGKTKLTAAEYIAELQKMVNDQRTWANNMKALAARVPPEMLEELRKLGPQGAAQVALLNSMSKKELDKVIALYLQSGSLSAQQFAAGITGQLGAIEAAASRVRIAASRAMQQSRQTGGFEHGGIVGAVGGGPRGGQVLVGEAGPEFVNLPYGSNVIPAGTTRAMMNGNGGSGVVRIEFQLRGDEEMKRWFRKWVRIEGGGDVQVAVSG